MEQLYVIGLLSCLQLMQHDSCKLRRFSTCHLVFSGSRGWKRGGCSRRTVRVPGSCSGLPAAAVIQEQEGLPPVRRTTWQTCSCMQALERMRRSSLRQVEITLAMTAGLVVYLTCEVTQNTQTENQKQVQPLQQPFNKHPLTFLGVSLSLSSTENKSSSDEIHWFSETRGFYWKCYGKGMKFNSTLARNKSTKRISHYSVSRRNVAKGVHRYWESDQFSLPGR